jgi:parallel beta-helix repeat protein
MRQFTRKALSGAIAAPRDRRRKQSMTRKVLGLAMFAAAMFAFAASAGAVDGTIEINQAKVLAAGGFPYVISTVNTSYRLTGSLTAPASTDAIKVNVNNVTIDLNGFSIVGPGGTGTYGVNAGGMTRTTVENGTVTGFGSGSGINAGNDSIVKFVHADSNNDGIQVGSYSLIQNCTADSNTTFGIYATNGTVISGNAANTNSYGIYIGAGSSALIIGNTITNNTTDGINGGSTSVGYSQNILFNNAANVGGTATSMGGGKTNLCNGAPC